MGVCLMWDQATRSDDSYQISQLHGGAAETSQAPVAWPQIDPDWANQLARTRPDLSAATPIAFWQKAMALGTGAGLLLGAFVWPQVLLTGLFAVLAPVFLSVVALRTLAIWSVVSAAPQTAVANERRLKDGLLPRYTVLVPLYRESEVVPQLLSGLRKLDYPKDRLQIIFAIEPDDALTLNALERDATEDHMLIVIAPEGLPRTKPRALMYALQFAHGEYVVVYDAEDVPEPHQLRKALQRFVTPHRKIGCVQARLNIYNPRQSWLTRQFTFEYTALFDAILPALQRLNLPVPLGGTSNHFPRAVLDEVGGWDPYNVTEDADLGIRLARAGWAVDILNSTTWEEAPARFDVWFGQRVRWLKGWMQTYLVHNRNPGQLWRDLGAWRFIGLQVLMGGLILSAFVHPWFYAAAAYDAWHGGDFMTAPDAGAARVLWWLGVINLVLAYLTAVTLSVLAVIRRSNGSFAVYAVLVPVYWLLISAAAYRALAQLITAPFWWQKTSHNARSRAGFQP
jgi:glycosyltransferase XagB